MKIGVIGDTHLGFDFGGLRQEDSFRNLQDAFAKVLAEKPDLIIQLGDIFHDRLPKPEIMGPAVSIFNAANAKLEPAKLLRTVKNGKEKSSSKKISPIICLYGNHERRSAQYVNPVQIMEKAGMLRCLHAESIIIQAGKEQLGIHGLSGVPRGYAREALQSWNPKPFPNIPNIFLIHQFFNELAPQAMDELSYADLPPGFDIYLCGDIHWTVEEKHPSSGNPIIIPGSTVKTQLKKIEAEKDKLVYLLDYDANRWRIKRLPLTTPRTFKYKLLQIGSKKPSEVTQEIIEDVKREVTYHTKELAPILRYKLKGQLAHGFLPTDLNFSALIKKFEGKALVFVDKSDIESLALSKRAKLLADLKAKKISIDRLGVDMLCKQLKDADIKKVDELFQLLSNGDIEKARSIL